MRCSRRLSRRKFLRYSWELLHLAEKTTKFGLQSLSLNLSRGVGSFRMERMREKIMEYAIEGAEWPLAANILDPIRCHTTCLHIWTHEYARCMQ